MFLLSYASACGAPLMEFVMWENALRACSHITNSISGAAEPRQRPASESQATEHQTPSESGSGPAADGSDLRYRALSPKHWQRSAGAYAGSPAGPPLRIRASARYNRLRLPAAATL